MIQINRLLIPALVAALALGGCNRDDGAGARGPVASTSPGTDEQDQGTAVPPDDGHDHALDDPTTPDPVVEAVEHVELTADQRRRIDLQLAVAGPGSVDVETSFPGEIVLNPDRMAHVVPRTAGIVREVHRTLGDHVEAGEILAWIESDGLAEAKLDFYAKQAELGCCMVELPRAEEIFQNTNRLLALLATEPAAEDLRTLDGLEMGEHRGRLITAYVQHLAAGKTYQRERELHAKNISSEKELVEAEAASETAQAELAAAVDIARYRVQIGYSEAARRRQVAEFEAVAAEQRLRLKGVDDEVIQRLLTLVPKTGSLEPCLCDDPNCTEHQVPSVLETLGREARLGWYALRAPFAGYITEKHLTLGEMVGADQGVLSIADTSTVWVRFNVFQKALGTIRAGQEVRVDVGAGLASTAGTIASVDPLVDVETRTALARVQIDNPDGSFRPGLYAMVHVHVEPQQAPVVIDREAVQVLDDAEVVFVEDGDGFAAVPVRLGRSNHRMVEVLAGLEPGQRYVERGAFELKASIVTGGLDSHAGHGH